MLEPGHEHGHEHGHEPGVMPGVAYLNLVKFRSCHQVPVVHLDLFNTKFSTVPGYLVLNLVHVHACACTFNRFNRFKLYPDDSP